MSVAENVEEYVESRPYVQESLAEDIVNYAALARKIQDDIGGSFDAVKMALRRLSDSIRKQRRTRRKNIGKVMEGTSIELENNVQVCKSDKVQEGKIAAETRNGHTAIQKSGRKCVGEVIGNQVIVTLKSPENLEGTPGVLSYVLSILAARDINVTELISCREDTHIVVHEDDATEVFKLLNDKLKG